MSIKQNKWCFIPTCKNTSVSTPDKLFLSVPQSYERKKRWFDAARREMPTSKSRFFCCEDHFDLEEDMENFVRFKLMGGHITLKPDVVPHKFACQPNGKNGSARKRPISAKRERKPFIVGEFVEVKEERSTAFDEDVYSGVDSKPPLRCDEEISTTNNDGTAKEIIIKIEKTDELSDKIKQEEIDINDLEINPSIVNKKRQLTCDVCNRSFSSKWRWKEHLNTHLDEKPYKCDYCEKSFVRESYLLDHKNLHTREKIYTCDLCKKNFALQSSFRVHLWTHKKLYKCGFCEKSFAYKKYMLDHENTHTREKIYTCDFCKKDFTLESSLKLHLLKHQKVYKCGFCDRSFIQKKYLVDHENIHKGVRPYSCDVCKKTFTRKSSLREHLKIEYLDEKPYKCSFCKKGFFQKGQLTIHERNHTGDKPYICDKCNKSFPSKGQLCSHMRMHSKEALQM